MNDKVYRNAIVPTLKGLAEALKDKHPQRAEAFEWCAGYVEDLPAVNFEASADELKDMVKSMSDGQFIALLDIVQAEGIKRAARAILDGMEAENEI